MDGLEAHVEKISGMESEVSHPYPGWAVSYRGVPEALEFPLAQSCLLSSTLSPSQAIMWHTRILHCLLIIKKQKSNKNKAAKNSHWSVKVSVSVLAILECVLEWTIGKKSQTFRAELLNWGQEGNGWFKNHTVNWQQEPQQDFGVLIPWPPLDLHSLGSLPSLSLGWQA